MLEREGSGPGERETEASAVEFSEFEELAETEIPPDLREELIQSQFEILIDHHLKILQATEKSIVDLDPRQAAEILQESVNEVQAHGESWITKLIQEFDDRVEGPVFKYFETHVTEPGSKEWYEEMRVKMDELFNAWGKDILDESSKIFLEKVQEMYAKLRAQREEGVSEEE